MSKTILVQEQPMVATELIEIPVASGATRATIPDVPQLRNQGDQVVILKAIRLITAKVLSTGPVTGTTNMALVDLIKCSLVLYSSGWEKMHLLPLLVMNDMADSDATTASTLPYRFNPTKLADWQNVDWNKSYIQFANGTSASAARVVILQVEYVRYQKTNNGYKNIDNG